MKNIIIEELSKISKNIVSGKIELEKIIKDRKNANLLIAKYSNISYEKLKDKFKYELLEGSKNNLLTNSQIKISLQKMNPLLARILIVEAKDLEKNKNTTSADSIKNLLAIKKNDQFNSINDPIERLESFSLHLIHKKLNESLANNPEIEQSHFISIHLNKSLQSFDLLDEKYKEDLMDFDNLKIKRKPK